MKRYDHEDFRFNGERDIILDSYDLPLDMISQRLRSSTYSDTVSFVNDLHTGSPKAAPPPASSDIWSLFLK